MPQNETITGEFHNHGYRGDDNWGVAFLVDGSVVVGKWEDGELLPGVVYTFYGQWQDHSDHGRQFAFKQFVQREPHSRTGVVSYLEKYATWVGPRIAMQLFDVFGSEAVAVLRTQPKLAADAVKGLSIDRANDAAAALKELARLEDTRIQLTTLFAHRGFPQALTEEVIRKWGIHAPARIKRDPLTLVVNDFDGCGWARCDRLYLELGLPPWRLKRQMIALWYLLHGDMSGSTWVWWDGIKAELGRAVGGVAQVNAEKARKLGERSGWLKSMIHDGVLYVAEARKASNEEALAGRVVELMNVEQVA